VQTPKLFVCKGGRNPPCSPLTSKVQAFAKNGGVTTQQHTTKEGQLTPRPPLNPYTGSRGSQSWQGPKQRRWSRPRRYVHSSLRLTGRSSSHRLLPLERAYTSAHTAHSNQQVALEKGEYAQAYALVPDPGLGGNVLFPLLVCKGLAAQGMGGKTEVSLQSGGDSGRGRRGGI